MKAVERTKKFLLGLPEPLSAPFHLLRARRLPKGLFLTASNKCNLRCEMCPYLELHEKNSANMTMQTFNNFLPLLKRLEWVLFGGLGEPLLNPQLVEMLKAVKKANPRIETRILTNGMLINKSFLEKAVPLIDFFGFSFDGCSQQTVKKMRAGINPEKVLENIRLVAEARARLNKKMITETNYVVNCKTYKELPAFIELAGRLGVNQIRLLNHEMRTRAGFKKNFYFALKKDKGKDLRAALVKAEKAKISVILPFFEKPYCGYMGCPMTSADGSVYACCNYVGKRIITSDTKIIRFPETPLGNVNDSNFEKIWREKKSLTQRSDNLKGKFKGYCLDCMQWQKKISDAIKENSGG